MQQRYSAVGFLGANSFLGEATQTAFMRGVPDGGFGEDRTSVLDTVFHPDHPRPLIHLGSDFQVPPGTPVRSWSGGTIVEVYTDPADFCGWGTRVTVAAGPYMFVHAHLAESAVRVGDTVCTETVLGLVGTYTDNGGWFPHVHVQKCDQSWFRRFTPETLPGYATSVFGNYEIKA